MVVPCVADEATVNKLIHLSRSKRRYKIMSSVILGQLESFRNYKGRLQYYFPENFRYNLKFYESNNFSDSSLHRIFESEHFRFPFSTKNSLT